MATVNKDFKIKSGLIVEGANGTINGYNILTESQDSIDFIVDTIGGTATPINTPDTVVKRDGSGDFAAGTITANLVGDVTGNADTATALETARTIQLTGDVTGSVSFDGTANVQISTTLDAAFATDLEVASAKQEAIDAAALDATSKANTAQSNANTYTDTALESYTPTSSLDTTVGGYGYLKSADLGDYATEVYVDNAVAGLVDGAPALLDTLNELAAAIADNPNYATDVANLVATKADTAYVDSEISTALTTAQGYADTAETDAKAYADGLAVNYDPAGAASTAETNANSYTDTSIGNLTTNDIEEVDNLYFTDARATNAAGVLLANATKSNITISYDSQTQSLTVEAENGVAGSTTDDLTEGGNNLYFTDERAIDAVSGVTIWPEAVVFNNLAKQVAATATVATASETTVYSWAKADYRTAKFLVKTAYGTHTDVAEVLLTLDTSDNIAITEYAMVGTNGSAMTISADISGTDVRLRVTTLNNNSTVTVVGTLLA